MRSRPGRPNRLLSPAVMLRKELMLTQIQLARVSSVPVEFVSKIENQDFSSFNRGDANRLRRMADALDVEPNQIAPDSVYKQPNMVPIQDCDETVLARAMSGMSRNPILESSFNELKTAIGKALHSIDGRQCEAITMKFGLGGSQPMTLDEIGNKFNVNRERARQIINAGLLRLSHPLHARRMEPFLEHYGLDSTPNPKILRKPKLTT